MNKNAKTRVEAEAEPASRIYRSKRMDATEPGEARVYYPKRVYGEQGGRVSARTTEGAARTLTEPSISAAEIRANSRTTAGTSSGTTASGGAAKTPTKRATRR